MTRSFKDVGYKQYDIRKVEVVDKTLLPIGIKTPLQFSFNGSGTFDMNYQVSDQIKDNLRNLIQTNFGERVGRYDFGANLRELLFEYTSKDDFENEVMIRINTAVAKWMPFIELSSFDSVILTDGDTDKISKSVLQIGYSVPKAYIYNEKVEVVIFIL